MKYFQREYYDDTIAGYLGFAEPINSWLKDKDVVLCGRKRVTKRHRRSIAKRDLHRLCPRYRISSYYGYSLKVSIVFLKTADGLVTVDSPRFKASTWIPCRRLIWSKEV